MGAAPAGADPLQDADATVEQLRRDADQASQAYFDALARAQTLDAEVTALEARLPDLAARRQTLQATTEIRAVEAYKRAGHQIAAVFDSADVLTAARRTQWLGRLNERDHRSFEELTRVSARLVAQRDELHHARQAQQATLDQIQAQGRDIDARLQAAENRRHDLQAAAARPVNPKGSGGAAPPPPADYVPTPGAHAMHDDPFLVCTRTHESHGNYGAYNPAGPYLGAYQFLQSTWNSTANHAGRAELIGVPPNGASEFDQDDMAWTLYQWQGSRPWGGRCG
jgi:hypothetical protein